VGTVICGLILFATFLWLQVRSTLSLSLYKRTFPLTLSLGTRPSTPAHTRFVQSATQATRRCCRVQTRTTELSLMVPCTCASDSARHGNELVFNVIDGHYFLWQIWTAGYDNGRELSIKSRDTEVASASPVQTLVIKATVAKG